MKIVFKFPAIFEVLNENPRVACSPADGCDVFGGGHLFANDAHNALLLHHYTTTQRRVLL
jgi:hypothetical protein